MDKTYTNGSDRTEEHILVCLSSSPSIKIVHTAAMAAALHHVLPRFMFKTEYYRIHLIKRLEEHIHFAEKLGAEIVTTHGENIPVQIAEYAHLSNVTKSLLDRAMQNKPFFQQGRTHRAVD